MNNLYLLHDIINIFIKLSAEIADDYSVHNNKKIVYDHNTTIETVLNFYKFILKVDHLKNLSRQDLSTQIELEGIISYKWTKSNNDYHVHIKYENLNKNINKIFTYKYDIQIYR